MWSKTIYFQFVALYILSLVPWPNPNVMKLFCSKDNARLVRKLIQIKWTPILDKYHVKLPINCPLHPFRDIFGPQQDAKKRERPTQWTCRLCGKSFFEEKFIDKHFESRHREFINKAEDAVCFADFCDLMRCEVFLSQDLNFITDDLYGATDIEVWSDTTSSSSYISSSSLAQTNTKNLLQLRKKNVLSIATAIAGTSAQKISGMHFHTRHFCRDQSDESASQNEDEDLISKKNDNEPKACENRSQQEFSDNDNNKHDHNSNMQKIRYNCKPEELAKLKIKCEHLIRNCITGLLLEMSDYAFKEMEEELNKAVCWYLTCDRYWEDGPLEPKAFPWGLILVLVMVLSLGICFCYYIIWILFDSDETINNRIQALDQYSPTRYRQKRIFQRNIKIDNTGGNTSTTNTGGNLSYDSNQDIIKEEKYPEDLHLMQAPDVRDLTQNEHYIYVTYPPDLKRRLFEKYE